LDKQLKTLGVPLSSFHSQIAGKTPTAMLARGQKRKFVEVDGALGLTEGMPPDRKVKRCVVVCADNSQRFEVPRFRHPLRPHLSITGDLGGSGLPAWNFLLNRMKIRGSIYPDPFHRVCRDWKLALQRSNAWSYVMEGQTLVTWLHGPWKSEAWFGQMTEAMNEYIAECGCSEDSIPDPAF
jgi:hypothetical protein